MSEKWHYEHSEFECDKCKTDEGAFDLDYYIGTKNGRDAQKYSCTNEHCGYEEIIYDDELVVKEDGTVEKHVNNDVGKKITLANEQTRILRQDKKGIYVIMGGVKNYVYYMDNYKKYAMTGEWDYKE